MKKVLKIDENGLFIEDVILQNSESIPCDCIETLCQEGLYKPKWDGKKWIEAMAQSEIDNLIASQPLDAKTEAIEEIESATTISALKSAMLKFVNAN